MKRTTLLFLAAAVMLSFPPVSFAGEAPHPSKPPCHWPQDRNCPHVEPGKIPCDQGACSEKKGSAKKAAKKSEKKASKKSEEKGKEQKP